MVALSNIFPTLSHSDHLKVWNDVKYHFLLQILDKALNTIPRNHFSNLAKNLTADVKSEFNPTTVPDLVQKFKDSDDKLLYQYKPYHLARQLVPMV